MNCARKLHVCFLTFCFTCGGSGTYIQVRAEDPVPETVVAELTNPAGVAVQPKTGHIFVSDSGASRVIRVVEGKTEEVIAGFPKDVYGKGPTIDIGPLGLVFLDDNTLVVGGGGLPDGQELLRVYAVPAAGHPALKAENMQSSFNLPAAGDNKGEGNFYGLAATRDAIYVTCNGDDTKGWLARATVKGTKVGPFERFLATKEATHVDAPVAITISPRGELVVGQMGGIDVPNDSLLTFYTPAGKMLMNLETKLHDISGLAYSPKTGQLFALDYHWPNGDEAGLFRLTAAIQDGKQSVRANKIVPLPRPTAMAFAPDGTLYITVIGETPNAKTGTLIKMAPGL